MKRFTHQLLLILSMALAIVLPWQAAQAASSAKQAFDDLVSSANASGPGYYTSGTRNLFVGGSLRVFTPTTTISLITITPPSLSAGCGGISAYFGGFSFINGAQFKQLVENVMRNAVGYVVEVAIRILCPICADILQDLQKIAQAAAGSAADSCRMAQALVGSTYTSLTGKSVPPASDGYATQSRCSTGSADDGGSKDFLDAMNNACSSVFKALNWISDKIASAGTAAEKTGIALDQLDVAGNKSWAGLTAAGYTNTYIKEVVLSATGFSSVSLPRDSTGTVKSDASTNPAFFPGWMEDENVLSNSSGNVADTGASILSDILLWGADPTVTKSELAALGMPYTAEVEAAAQRAASLNYKSLPFYKCRGAIHGGTYEVPADSTPAGGLSAGGNPNVSMCDYAIPRTVGSVADSTGADGNPLITKSGLIVSVVKLLNEAIEAVATGKKMPDDAVKLMQITPLPLYRMVNVAAVYPDVAQQMIDIYGKAVGYLIVSSVVSSWLRTPDAVAPGIQMAPAAVAAAQAMKGISDRLITAAQSQVLDINKNLSLQTSILAQIQSVNDVMYSSLAATNIQGNLAFTQAMSRSTSAMR